MHVWRQIKVLSWWNINATIVIERHQFYSKITFLKDHFTHEILLFIIKKIEILLLKWWDFYHLNKKVNTKSNNQLIIIEDLD